MSELVWGLSPDRIFETGIDRGVFFPKDGDGIPWNGLSSVKEAPTGGEIESRYVDGRKYTVQQTHESFAAVVSAYTYPVEAERYFGNVDRQFRSPGLYYLQQQQREFNFSYRTLIGNGESSESGYKIHLVYNALMSPTDRSYETLGDSVDPLMLSWQLTTRPEKIEDNTGHFQNSAHLVIDTRYAYAWAVEALEAMLYGTADTTSRFPTPAEIFQLFENASILKITNHGDGTWTAEGPDDVVKMLDATSFEINWPSVVYIDSDTYQVSSL